MSNDNATKVFQVFDLYMIYEQNCSIQKGFHFKGFIQIFFPKNGYFLNLIWRDETNVNKKKLQLQNISGSINLWVWTYSIAV